MAKLTEDEVLAIVREEISKADGWNEGELSSNRQKALDYYYGRRRGDEIPGRSSVQSLDVADMVTAIIAQIVPMISGDTICEFEPDSEDDEDQAHIETMIVNNTIIELNMGFVELQSAILDALLLRNGVIKVWMDIQETVKNKTYEGLDEETLTLMLSQQDEVNQVELVSRDDNKTVLRHTTTIKKLKVASVDPVDFVFASNWYSPFLTGIRFCAEKKRMTRSELLDMGFSAEKVAELPPFTSETKGDADARNKQHTGDFTATEKSQDIIEVWECYLLVDLTNSGKASTLQRIMLAGEATILDNEEVDFLPYATGSPFIQPHRHVGESIFDRIRTVQDGKTAVLRQWIDNISRNNNRRAALVEGQVNLDDWTQDKPGGGVRVRSPDAIIPIPVDDAGPSSASLLEYYDKIRTERGGASLDMIGADFQIAGDTAHGIERQFSSREQMAQLIIKNLAETLIRQTYLITHMTMRSFMTGEVAVRSSGEWTASDPSTWKERHRVNVVVGMTVGERMRRQSALGEVVAKLEQIMQMGLSGQLTDLKGYYQALNDWAEASMLDNSEKYLIDPTSEQAQQAAQAQQQQQSEMQQQQQQMQAALMKMQTDLETYKVDVQTAQKYWSDTLKAEVEQAKIVGSATLELEKLQAQGEAASRADGGAGGSDGGNSRSN